MAASYPKILLTGTQAEYNGLGSYDSNKLYWTSDTHKIYKGNVDFTEYVKAVATRPSTTATLAAGTLYLCADTGKADFWDGTNWHTLNLPEVASFSDSTADDVHVPTTKAVMDYVASVIGGSSDVVKSITAGSSDAVITYETADDVAHNVTVPGVVVDIEDKEVSDVAQAAQFSLVDSDGGRIDYTVPKVMTGVAADDTDAATLNVTLSSGSHADVVVPKVMTGITAGTADGEIAVTLSSGTHSNVTVPGVFNAVSYNATTGTLTFTDTSGVSTGEDHVIELGKDKFIDPAAPNRYENGNIYLYLNTGGAGTTEDTEIVIPVTGLITDYFGDDTASIAVSIDNNTHKVTADAVLRADVPETTAGAGDGFTNALKVSTSSAAVGGKGLYVDLSDIEDSIDALAEATTVWGSFV